MTSRNTQFAFEIQTKMMSIVTQTKCGPVRGIDRATSDGKLYYAFFGIPYAQKPIGELRFRDPQPCEPWTDEFDATVETSGAFQVSEDGASKTVIGSENCLILNVYTQNLTSMNLLPVFVWIHGGGFAFGSSTSALYRPDYFLDKGIVVVTINYRLGALGFLSFKDPEVGIPGNAGLKDQSMALRWVKENIANFGGDPENITLGGESAGAGAVNFHLISPMSKGLFHRAIMQSGSVYSPWASMPDEESYEYELARELGWNGEGGDRGAFDVIASTEVRKLVLITPEFVKNPAKRLLGCAEYSPFLPRVEPYGSEMCFLPKPILELGREAWSKDIPVLIGGNRDEGFAFETNYKQYAPILEKDFCLLVPLRLRVTLNEEKLQEATKILKELYFGNDPVNLESPNKFYEIIADVHYWQCVYRTLLQRHHYANSPTFLYFLAADADMDLKVYQILRKLTKVSHLRGTSHSDDLALIWKSIFSKKPTLGNKSFRVFLKFFGAYSNFIKTGNPNHPSLGVDWKPMNENLNPEEEEIFNCMKFNNTNAEFVPFPIGEKMLVWNKIYDPGCLF